MDGATNATLLAGIRAGDVDAFAKIYALYLPVATLAARGIVDNPGDVEDVVADAFHIVLERILDQTMPRRSFRQVLIATITRLSQERNGESRRVWCSPAIYTPANPEDVAIQAFEVETVARAFRSLPARWRSVLWYLNVRQLPPREAAPLLGVSPNAVSSLEIRATRALRRQHLQFLAGTNSTNRCAAYHPTLGALALGVLPRLQIRKTMGHLAGCHRCAATLTELQDIARSFRLPVPNYSLSPGELKQSTSQAK